MDRRIAGGQPRGGASSLAGVLRWEAAVSGGGARLRGGPSRQGSVAWMVRLLLSSRATTKKNIYEKMLLFTRHMSTTFEKK